MPGNHNQAAEPEAQSVRTGRSTRRSNLFALKRVPPASAIGLTPVRSKAFIESGFESLYDLVNFFPRRYVDRRNHMGIWEATPGADVLVIGTVRSVTSRFTKGRREIVQVVVADQTGSLAVTFFNQPWRKRQLQPGLECALFGRMEVFGRKRQMVNPLVDLIGDRTGRIVPIYPQSEKYRFKPNELVKAIATTLKEAGRIEDPLPEAFRGSLGLIDRDSAYRLIHAPGDPEDYARARERLAFDELLRIQLQLVAAKAHKEQQARGIRHSVGALASKGRVRPVAPDGRTAGFHTGAGGAFQPGLGLSDSGDLASRFLAQLPFAPTSAQLRVVGEIAMDMASAVPMHRLLQGDVGSGKTMVAVCAALFAIQSGYQAVLMAPTEVLAEQHFLGISRLLAGLEVDAREEWGLFGDSRRPLKVEMLTNKVVGARRKSLLGELLEGRVDLVVGTHALLSEGVEFSRLGLVVVDEQHRFGVEQRSLLRERSLERQELEPDVLVMTATPIPRTAAMTIFGDLDYSVLDELPPGRTPIRTRRARNEEEIDKVFARLAREVASGRQAYIVCPLVEESEKVQAASATATYEELTATRLSDMRVGLLHGQMPTAEKAQVMERFRQHELDVLVSTTVIEVGVDVPNATVMVILDAARFGIAQIHQLRGRVGRGAAQSYCYLVETAELDSVGEGRLQACVESTDGFFLAERDLELRGEGTLLGARQKGTSDLRIASLAKDRRILESAREVARALVGEDPTLGAFEELRGELEGFASDQDAEYLFRS